MRVFRSLSISSELSSSLSICSELVSAMLACKTLVIFSRFSFDVSFWISGFAWEIRALITSQKIGSSIDKYQPSSNSSNESNVLMGMDLRNRYSNKSSKFPLIASMASVFSLGGVFDPVYSSLVGV